MLSCIQRHTVIRIHTSVSMLLAIHMQPTEYAYGPGVGHMGPATAATMHTGTFLNAVVLAETRPTYTAWCYPDTVIATRALP